jgi:glutaredoxin
MLMLMTLALARRLEKRSPAPSACSAGYKALRDERRTTARLAARWRITMSKRPPVTIYSLTTCGWSRKAKEYFKQRGIKAFVIEYDTAGPDLRQKISAEMRKEGADGFPFVRIGGRVVKGYDPATYDRLLRGA